MAIKWIFLLGPLAVVLLSSQSYSMSVIDHAKYTFEDAFDTTGLEILGVGTVVTLIAFSQDSAMHDAWNHNQRMPTNVSALGDFWGSGIPEVAIALGQLIFDRENGIVDSEGLASSFIVTEGLKYGVGRQRPDSTNTTSFPSGHTQVSFASATSLTMSYGWWVGIPMFALGAFTGLTRLADNAHWLSDITAGATIGVLFGRAGFKHHFNVKPLAINDGGNGAGLLAEWRL
jgi:membrane-associated phospholipid phosphatase